MSQSPMTPEEKAAWWKRRREMEQFLDEKLNGPPKDEAEMAPAERPSNTPVFEQMRENE